MPGSISETPRDPLPIASSCWLPLGDTRAIRLKDPAARTVSRSGDLGYPTVGVEEPTVLRLDWLAGGLAPTCRDQSPARRQLPEDRLARRSVGRINPYVLRSGALDLIVVFPTSRVVDCIRRAEVLGHPCGPRVVESTVGFAAPLSAGRIDKREADCGLSAIDV